MTKSSTDSGIQTRVWNSDAPREDAPRGRDRVSAPGRTARTRLLRPGDVEESWLCAVVPTAWDRLVLLAYAADAVDAAGYYPDEVRVFLRDRPTATFPQLEVRIAGPCADEAVAARTRVELLTVLDAVR